MQFIYQNRVHCGYLENYLENATKAMKSDENNGNEEEMIAKAQELYNLAECGKNSEEAQEKVKRSVNPDAGKGQKGIDFCS